jgi:hypothetical protein
MKLVRIARGRWDVVAMMDPHERCQVLDLLDETGPRYNPERRFLSVLLRVYLPLEGPPTCNRQLCRPLGDGLFELRQPQTPKPRILFFNDTGSRIVCTTASAEANVSPTKEIQAARDLRARYLETKSRRQLEVIEAGP